MTCQLTDDLRTVTKAAFEQYGGQAEAAKMLGVKRQYVWAVLNGGRDNDDFLLKLADFIDQRITDSKAKEGQKKEKTSRLKAVLTL